MFDIGVLAYNIKKRREAKGISQKELAEKIFVSPQAISKWECGVAVPEVDKLCTLAGILGCNLDALVGNLETEEIVMVGVDGGGTKTEYILFNEKGKIYKRIVGGGTNPNFYGIEKACEELKNAISSLFAIKSNIKGVFVGGAGFMTSKNGKLIKENIRKKFPMIKVMCASDMLNIIASATEEANCLGSISGTGNVTFAYKSGEITKYGGYGTLFDKAGSGYDIGREAILAALQDSEGVGEATLITELVNQKLCGNVCDMLQYIYKQNVSYIASFAQTVFEALEKGDKIAFKIIEESTDRVAELINIAYTKNKECSTVVLAGSLYKNSFFFESVKSKLLPELSVVVSENPPVLGACVLCCKFLGVGYEKIKENFAEEYERSQKEE